MKTIDRTTLINALHNAHESIEELIIEKDNFNSELINLDNLFKALLHASPNHYWHEKLVVTEFQKSKDSKTLSLWFKNIVANQQILKELSVRLQINEGDVSFFVNLGQSFDQLTSYVCDKPQTFTKEINCADRTSKGKLNEDLSRLKTSEWLNLFAAMHMLKKLFLSPPQALKELDIEWPKIANHVSNYIKAYEKWPSTLRHDEISISQISHSEHYHSLSIKLTRVSVSNNTYKTVSFILSTVETEASTFGVNPRLEFLEDSKEFIEGWDLALNNTQDNKLELRFASPNAIDTNVWDALSSKDKILIAGIIGKLPALVENLSIISAHKSMRWEEWKTLAEDVKSIFTKNMIERHHSIQTKKS